ncbi:hypothetical protein [Lacipirellula sp.]|uniref:hypothetical protein n=1 Tax=Lacipirellula sp. TaxID=2691419 RepID=UPI003D0F5F9E
MQAYQQYIDDILGAVYSPETADPDFLRDSAAMYAEACAEVNDRLRRVGRLLHRGLRSEAIQIAEEEPNLLDMVAMLDFSELPTWREMLVQWEMAEPPQLLIDLAADLNKAYADQQPLESLLKQHRTLALARAPLASRIYTLRQIRDADAGNEMWGADLCLMERARLKQIGAEVEGAHRNRDVAGLARLTDELRAKGWTVERPKSLIDTVEKFRSQVAAAAARRTLEQLDYELNDAYMAFDVAAARKLRDRWHESAGIAALSAEDELSVRAAPALNWLAEQDRQDAGQRQFQLAVAQLQQALDNGAASTELERLFRAATLFGEPLPELLQRRVEQTLAAEGINLRRKRRLVIGSIAAVLALIIGGIGYWMNQQAFAREVAESSSSLATLIDKGAHTQAQELLAGIASNSPNVALSGDVQAQKLRLDQAVAAEQSRVRQFQELISKAGDPSTDGADRGALPQLKKLAMTEEEKVAVSTLEHSFNEADRAKVREHDQRLSLRLVELQDQLAALDRNARGDEQRKLADLTKLGREISATKEQFKQASAAMLAQLDPLQARINTVSQGILARRRQAEFRIRITQSVGDADAFVAALNGFAESFPNSSIAGNVATLAGEASLWRGLLDCSEFEESNFGAGLPRSAKAARAAIKRGEELAATYGDLPFVERFELRKPYLVSVAAREPEAGDAVVTELNRLVRDPLIAGLQMITDKNGNRYYCRKAPEESDGTYKFDYLAGFDLSERPGAIRNDLVAFNGSAPQSEVAREIIAVVANLPTQSWESGFHKILKSIDNRKDLDPVLKLILLQKLVESGTSGSAVLSEGFREYQRALGEGNVDLSVPWMSPKDEGAAKERTRAETLLATLPSMDDAFTVAASQLQTLKASHEECYSWVGWLTRVDDGNWRVEVPSGQIADGKLVVIAKPPGVKTAVVDVIGEAKAGEARIANGASSPLVEGRPVFLRDSKSN